MATDKPNIITREQWLGVYNQLRPYQTEAVDFMLKNPRTLEFDDMGLGKTIITLTATMHKAIDKSEFDVLILCTTNALFVWKEEIQKWFGFDPIMYIGTPKQRKKIYDEQIKDSKFKLVITTYGMLKEMDMCNWDAILADEIHQAGLLKHTNTTFKRFTKVAKTVPTIYLLTGTPIRQGVIDTFAPLNIVAFSSFSNYWSFVNRHCIVTVTPFGKQIERNPRNIPEFREMMNKYMIRRLKSEVLKDLPGKSRNIVPLQMTPKQAKAHDDIMEELYYFDDDTLVVTPNKMTAILRARQILVTPRLLGIDDDGAALNYIREVGSDLIVAGRPFVIFTPFRQALPLIADVVREIDPSINIHLIHGGMRPSQFAKSWQTFEQPTTQKKVMICVIKSGASFHATASADSYFLGYEWDFNLNAQSEDRLCRYGQKYYVNCNYLLHHDTVDEDVKKLINEKSDSSDWIVGTEQQYQMILDRYKARRDKV
jgi:SNF2 family DNA or RNA helicase